MDHFQVFIEFVTILLLFHVLVSWPRGMWDSSSQTKVWTCTLALEGKVLTTGPPRKSPYSTFWGRLWFSSVQFSSVAQSCPTLCDSMNCSTPGLPVHHQLSEFTQTHVHRVGDAIQPSHPLLSPSPPAPNPSQHQGLFQWVNSSHEVAKVSEFQPQHQSFQWTLRTYLL